MGIDNVCQTLEEQPKNRATLILYTVSNVIKNKIKLHANLFGQLVQGSVYSCKGFMVMMK